MARALDRIQRALVGLETRKQSLLAGLSQWPAEQRCYRPDETSWCALDVVDHLRRVESAALGAMRKELPTRRPVAWSDRLRASVIAVVMRSPLRVKVPATATRVLPGKEVDWESCCAHWDETRSRLREIVAKLEPAQAAYAVYRHPVSGWMTMHDTLRFLSAHIAHHQFQVNRLRRGFALARRSVA